MLIRISLIVAILAGLAVGTLNFIKVKEKITTLQTNLKDQTDKRMAAEDDARKTHKKLDETAAKLKTTEQNLQTAEAERAKAVTDAAAQTKRADKLNDELTKTRQERDVAKEDLSAYTQTGVKPPEIMAMNKQYKAVQEALEGAREENSVLGLKIKKLQNELALYKTENPPPVYLPAGLTGRVLVTDPKWSFVVLNVGEKQGVLEYGELLVNRNGKLVAKVIVRSVQKDRCIANVMPGWQLGEVLEGDQVIPAHPAS